LLSITPDSEREFEVTPAEQALPQIGLLDQTDFYGKFVLEPLERGYGDTIGNALRRVLLSSIRGCGITAVKIDKVLHEFAAIPGVKEDTTEILLNLKDVAIKVDHEFRPGPEEELVLELDVRGRGRVTAADIQCPPGVEITTPEVYIAHISEKDTALRMEIYVGVGSGYVLPEKHEKYRQMIGVIPMGTQFTPVRKAMYHVDPARVGYKTDYERLVLEVETNGTVSPAEAVAEAGRILNRYFRMFFDLYETPGERIEPAEEVIPPELQKVPDTRIEEMDFSQRTFNCLRRDGRLTLRDLVQATEHDLTNIRGFGKKSLTEVKEKLASLGLELRQPKTAKSGYDEQAGD
jgi:DNA-directed RNA polymerase subunit alpha